MGKERIQREGGVVRRYNGIGNGHCFEGGLLGSRGTSFTQGISRV